MRQLLVLSGKGGAGKTTVATALVALSGTRAFADCDVDAPNLHLSTRVCAPATMRQFEGMPRACIDAEACIACGACANACRFGALAMLPDGGVAVDRLSCEGCKVCSLACPEGAISFTPEVTGETIVRADASEVFSSAYLRAGSGNSGKLVSEVKRNLASSVEGLSDEAKERSKFAVVDGSPGIGCPVIASLAKVAGVLIVAEPSASGVSDVERLVGVIERMRVKMALCVNRADIDPECAARLEALCADHGIAFAGRIPFDHEAARLIDQGDAQAGIKRLPELAQVHACVRQMLFDGQRA